MWTFYRVVFDLINRTIIILFLIIPALRRNKTLKFGRKVSKAFSTAVCLKLLLSGTWEFLYPLQTSLKKHDTEQCHEHDLSEGTSVLAGSHLPGKRRRPIRVYVDINIFFLYREPLKHHSSQINLGALLFHQKINKHACLLLCCPVRVWCATSN